MKLFPLSATWFTLGVSIVSATVLPPSSDIEMEILNTILHESKYDTSVRPPKLDQNKTNPLLVNLQFMIRHINSLDDINQEVSVQAVLRLSWQDPRHRYEHIFKHSPEKVSQLPDKITIARGITRIWYPDLFVTNEKNSYIHNVLQSNALVRISKNGTTYFSTRITMVTSCPMALEWYPFDKHSCPFKFTFYSLYNNEAELMWFPGRGLEILPGIQLPILQVTGLSQSGNILLDRNWSANFSSLVAQIEFERRLSYYLFRVYLPCLLLVVVSWTSFWLDVTAVDARVAIGLTTILAMATQLNGIAEGSPTVSYMKAVDIYSAVCQIFVTAAFLEFATVSFIVRKDGKLVLGQININSSRDKNVQNGGIPRYYRKQLAEICRGEDPKLQMESQSLHEVDVRVIGMRMDRICRIAYPSLFVGFAIVYFSICLYR